MDQRHSCKSFVEGSFAYDDRGKHISILYGLVRGQYRVRRTDVLNVLKKYKVRPMLLP